MRHAPHDSRLGRLQRGRGSGFLLALEHPAATRDELLRCIAIDPRVDPQVESRARYYAEIAVGIDLRAGPIVDAAIADPSSWLAVDVLAEMAVRGDRDAAALLHDPALAPDVSAGMLRYLRDYPTWTNANVPLAAIDHLAEHLHDTDELIADVEIYGEFWQPWAARLPRVEHAFVESAAAAAAEAMVAPSPVDDPTALSLNGLLADLDAQGGDRLAEELLRRTSAADREQLALHVQHHDSLGTVRVAARALADMGDLRLLDLTENLFALPDDPSDPRRQLSTDDRERRAALLWYFRMLPPPVTLPLARIWWHRGGFFRLAAGRVLAQHAEPRDREWLEPQVQQALQHGSGIEIVDELDALVHLRDRRSLPVLLTVAERATFAWARVRALTGLAAMADDPRARHELGDALWDCEGDARRLGCVHGPRTGTATERRLGELERDPLEDDDVRRAAAAARAAS